VIGLEKRLPDDLFCVEWDIKPQLSQSYLVDTLRVDCCCVVSDGGGVRDHVDNVVVAVGDRSSPTPLTDSVMQVSCTDSDKSPTESTYDLPTDSSSSLPTV